MTPAELTRRLRRLARKRNLAFEMVEGKGSHRHVIFGDRKTMVSFHPGDIPFVTFRKIMRQLGLTEDDLRE